MSQALEHGAKKAVVSSHWAEGGAGAVPLAKALVDAVSEATPRFK